MPGKQNIVYAGLSIEVLPAGEERGIYFTDEYPAFLLKISNVNEKKIRGGLTWFYGFGSGPPAHISSSVVEFDLDPGETTTSNIMGRLLGYQGNGVIAMPILPLEKVIISENSRERVLKPAPPQLGSYHSLYTFTIMDREFYRRVYEYPMEIQKQVRLLTVILVILTALYVAKEIGLIDLVSGI